MPRDLSAELAYFTQKVRSTGDHDYQFLIFSASPFDLTESEQGHLISCLEAQFQEAT